MVVTTPITIASFATDLARKQREVVRQIQDCAGCLRRTLATVFRPDARAAR